MDPAMDACLKHAAADQHLQHGHPGPLYWHDLTLIPEWISNYIDGVWDEFAYPFPYSSRWC